MSITAAETFTTVDDRVQTVLAAANVGTAIDDHATVLDAAVKVASAQVTTADMTTAGASQAFTVFTVPTGKIAVVKDAWFKLDEVVAGGTIDSATVQVGNDEATADPNAYVLSTNVFTGAGTGNKGLLYTEKGVDLVTVNTSDYGRNTALLSAGKVVNATLTVGTGDVADATTGDFTVFVEFYLVDA